MTRRAHSLLAWLGKVTVFDPLCESIKDEREKKRKDKDAARVRRLNVTELCDEKLPVLEDYENDISLHVYLTDWRDERALKRLREVRAAISWHKVGGDKPVPASAPASVVPAKPATVTAAQRIYGGGNTHEAPRIGKSTANPAIASGKVLPKTPEPARLTRQPPAVPTEYRREVVFAITDKRCANAK